MPDDVISVLVGDTVTEEALPTYAMWLAHVSSYMASCDASEASTLPSHSPAEVFS